jgi:hypothetical protein
MSLMKKNGPRGGFVALGQPSFWDSSVRARVERMYATVFFAILPFSKIEFVKPWIVLCVRVV